MKTIKIQKDLATEIKKIKKQSNIDILTQENEQLVKSLKKPG